MTLSELAPAVEQEQLRCRQGAEGQPLAEPDGDTQESAPPTLPQRHFVARCRGHWRIRAQPSLHAETLGSIASGTVVVGAFLDEGLHDGVPVEEGGDERWIRVERFESAKTDSVYVKNKQAEMYCYWRNARGHGLYEVGKDYSHSSGKKKNTHEGTRTNAETHDVSITWKILGHVDSLVRTFSQLSTPKEAGRNSSFDDGECAVRRSPADLFLQRQSEQLKEAARNLHQAASRLDEAAQRAGLSNPASGLPQDVHRRLARLSSQLAAFDRSELTCGAQTGASKDGANEPVDFRKLVTNCGRLECSPALHRVDAKLRMELVTFDREYTPKLQERARTLLKACSHATESPPPPSPALSEASTVAPDSLAAPDVAAVSRRGGPLPAPPPPAWGLEQPLLPGL